MTKVTDAGERGRRGAEALGHAQTQVFGVTAQEYRGPVSTNCGGTISTGYLKNYNTIAG